MLSKTLLAKELRELRWTLILGLIVLSGMAALIALSFELIHDYTELAIRLLGEEFAQELEFMMSSFDIYIWSQWNPKNLLQVGTLLAIILGSVSIAGEVGRGSLDFLASRPISRNTILINKMLAGGLILSLVTWVSTLVLIVTGLVVAELGSWLWILGATVVSNLGLLVVYAFTVMVSTMSQDAVKAGALSGAILLVYSGLGFFPRLHRLSVFWQMKAFDWVLLEKGFPWLTLLIFTLLIISLSLLSSKILNNKEF